MKKEVNIIRQAILNETEGYDFYMLAARQVDDPEAAEAFKQLAREEMKHIDWLKELHDKLEAGNPEEFDVSKLEDPPSPRIFQWKNAGRETGSMAVSVFGIGIQMEKAAIDFYKQAAESSQHAVARDLYTKLIDWEHEHLQQFQRDYDSLRDEWWQQQGFSPS